jgi:hypothetical protein
MITYITCTVDVQYSLGISKLGVLGSKWGQKGLYGMYMYNICVYPVTWTRSPTFLQVSQVRQNEIKINMEKSYATHTHHTHVYDIQHIALFDRLYLDPKANPKFLNFKDLGNTSTGEKE